MIPPRRQRVGFTLIELLVVITILGILVALLLPVIWGAYRTAQETRVAAEINTLTQSLTSFKEKFGDFPPSRIILPETGGYNVSNPPADLFGIADGGNAFMNYGLPYESIGGQARALAETDITYAALAQRSIRTMQSLFPKVKLTSGAGSSTFDFNGNGAIEAEPILLEGHECLVFFLGGIPVHDGSGIVGVSGFGTNPLNPFLSEFADPERTPPIHEFDVSRLVDDDLDGIPGFIDPLGESTEGRYYAYFSSYDGSGYDPNDVNFTLDEGPLPVFMQFGVSFPVKAPSGTGPSFRVTPSPLPNPYTTSVPFDGSNPSNAPAASFVNKTSFQLFSPGRDRLYGTGGQFSSRSDLDSLPGQPSDPRDRELDNITNFTQGTIQ